MVDIYINIIFEFFLENRYKFFIFNYYINFYLKRIKIFQEFEI